jgi:hypothetical protein
MGLIISTNRHRHFRRAATFGHTGTLRASHAMFVRRPDGLTYAITVSGDLSSSTRDLATIMDNASSSVNPYRTHVHRHLSAASAPADQAQRTLHRCQPTVPVGTSSGE